MAHEALLERGQEVAVGGLRLQARQKDLNRYLYTTRCCNVRTLHSKDMKLQ
jgi:hypothetical protein